tara:strand:- start:1974 stop:3611 length:1638 start_codon:yes stop_codon:yes gene_type:complete
MSFFTKFLVLFLISLISKISFSQEKSFLFYLNEQFHLMESYLNDSSIDIVSLRNTTDFLTNIDIAYLDDIPIVKRKKAFIRHVKHISEKLEEVALDNKKVNDTILNWLSELEYLKLSIIEKSKNNNSPFLTKTQKINLTRNTLKSNRIMQYPISPSNDVNAFQSIYWNPLTQTNHKEFKNLSKLKKVKPKKEMAIIFKKLSYTGSSPKISTYDLNLDDEWSLKWGDEINTDVVASRLFASLGYDVDHPYCYLNGKLMLIFDGTSSINNWNQLKDSILFIYNINLDPFFLESGTIDMEIVANNDNLSNYIGNKYVTFIKCGIEARPDRVKRLGTFLPNKLYNSKRLELRGALLLHSLIGNWDTRKENTLLTTIHDGDYNYNVSAVFSDLGTSFGVSYSIIPSDFKVGLVNEFSWELATKKNNKIYIKNAINEFSTSYLEADYNDLRWMAKKISLLDSLTLRKCISKAKWPYPIEELYFNKLASRRASILESFDLVDPNPIYFNRKINIKEDGKFIVRKGKLVVDYKKSENPESFLTKKGRKRNYGY